jgi:multiple sugar transport system substrate-binding protein
MKMNQNTAGRKIFLGLLTALMLIGTSALAQEVREVTFWSAHGEPDLSVIRSIVESFNEEHADINVTLTQIPPGEVTDVTRLMTAVRGGIGPDVYMLDRFIVAQRAADGLLQDLSQFMTGEDENFMDNYIDFARQEAMFDDRPYALPFDTDARALYYNRRLLEEAGIDPAELDSENGPITFDRLRDIAFQVNERDDQGNYLRMGFVPWFDQGWHYGYGFSFGGEFFDEATCEVTPTHPGVVEAFQYVYDFANELDPPRAQGFMQAYAAPGTPPQQHPFITEQVAMMISGDWFISNMERYAPDVDYGITYMPVPNEGDESVTWAGGWSMVIPQGAREPEAAFEFLKYIAGPPGQRVYTAETQHMPTWEALLDEEELYDEQHLFFSELLPLARNRPPLPVGALYWDELTAAWQRVYLNEQEPQAALEEVQRRVQPQLQRFCEQMMGQSQ